MSSLANYRLAEVAFLQSSFQEALTSFARL